MPFRVWKAGKGIYLLMFVYTIFATLLPIAGIFMPRLIIEELQKLIYNLNDSCNNRNLNSLNWNI